MSKIEDWKVGDKGIIVSNEHSHSKFSVGDIVIITSIEDDFVWCKNVKNETGCADFRDIKKFRMLEDKKYKFRICDILGVDIGQEFFVRFNGGVHQICINEFGNGIYKHSGVNASDIAIYAINHPESVTICDNQKDKEYAQKIYEVFGRDGTIMRAKDGRLTFSGFTIRDIGFKNIKPGDSVKLSELIDIS